jgi:hypothetical protein
MKIETYTQCELVKGNVFQHAWIPTRFAVIGKVLRIKEDGEWEDDWIVKHVYKPKIISEVEERERDYLKFSYGKKK